MRRKYRKHVRLKGFDYSGAGYYFVTICTKNRQKLFLPFVDPKYGHKIPDRAVTAIAGNVAAPLCGARQRMTEIVVEKLKQIPKYYLAEADFYVTMPDHLHLIVNIKEDKEVPLELIVKALKSWVTMGIKKAAQSAAATNIPKFSGSVWRPNYYEHIIRKEEHLEVIRRYILTNPNVEYESINWKKLDPL